MNFSRLFSTRKQQSSVHLYKARLWLEPLEDRCLLSHGSLRGTVLELEPPGTQGQNDSLATAQFLPGVGTGRGETGAVDILGNLGPEFRVVETKEDDGSIPRANPTGLVAGSSGSILMNGVIGDGHGAGLADYDYYLVSASAGQLLTVDVSTFGLGSSLDSVVGIYDSAGNLLAFNNDKSNTGLSFFNLDLDSRLRFLAPADDTDAVVVFGRPG
jgi:hypothetical protein